MRVETHRTDTASPKRPRPLLLTTAAALAAGVLTGWWMTPELAVEHETVEPAAFMTAEPTRFPAVEPSLRPEFRSGESASFASFALPDDFASPEPPTYEPANTFELSNTFQDAEPASERVTVAGPVPEPLNPLVDGAEAGCDGPYASEPIGCSPDEPVGNTVLADTGF